MDAEKVIYKHLPPTSELVALLTLPKKITRWDRWVRILLGVIILAVVAMFGCVGLIKLAWLPKHETGIVGLIFMGVAVLAWTGSVLIDLVQGAGTILDPAKELAEQFDRDMAAESRLLPSFQTIPVAVLLARHQRLELHLQAWEKWRVAAEEKGRDLSSIVRSILRDGCSMRDNMKLRRLGYGANLVSLPLQFHDTVIGHGF